MQIPSEFSSSLSDPASSFVDFMSTMEFSSVLTQENAKSQSHILKMGELSYQVTEDVPSVDSFMDDGTNTQEDYRGDAKELSSGDALIKELGMPFVGVQVTPMPLEPFLAQLPVHLSSFIQETVQIVKAYNAKSERMDVLFRFKNLGLQVQLSQRDDGLKIVIQVGDKELRSEFNKERQELMVVYLQSKLDVEADQLDVQFDFSELDQDSTDSQSSSDAEEQDSDGGQDDADA